MKISLKFSFYHLGLLIFLLLFLKPYPQSYIGSMGVRIIDLLLVFITFVYCSLNFEKLIEPKVFNISLPWFLIFVFGLFSIFLGYYYGFTTFSFRDILDISRYIQYPIFIFFGYLFARKNSFQFRHFLVCINILILLIFILAVLQKVFPYQTSFITKLYAPEHQSARLFTTERVTTFFGNPNTTALLTSMFASFVFADNIVNKKHKYFYIILAIIIVVLSGSRTGLLGFSLLLMVYVYIKIKNKALFFILATSLLTAIWYLRNEILEIVKYFNQYMYLGLKLIMNLEFSIIFQEGNTFSKRFNMWQQGIDYFLQSPVFGVGPLRGVISSSTDNFYIYLLVRNGIIGILLYFTYIVISLKAATRAIKTENKIIRVLGNAYIFQTVIILFMNFLIEAQIQNTATYLYFTTFGILIGFGSKQNIYESSENSTSN